MKLGRSATVIFPKLLKFLKLIKFLKLSEFSLTPL